jgi:hypothetical protein
MTPFSKEKISGISLNKLVLLWTIWMMVTFIRPLQTTKKRNFLSNKNKFGEYSFSQSEDSENFMV